MEEAVCKSCGRKIRWVLSPTGAKLPLAARPVTVYTIDEQPGDPRAVKHETPEKVYISHYVDCLNPASFTARNHA